MIGEYTEGVLKANQHFFQLGSLADGETLGRVRFTWQATHPSNTAADGAGFVIASGINVVPAGTSTGSMDYPFDNPSADWVWWEAGILQPMFVGDATTPAQELDVYPFGDVNRDTRAQRIADTGGSDVWFQTQTSNLSAGQCDHYLTVSASLLVLLAP